MTDMKKKKISLLLLCLAIGCWIMVGDVSDEDQEHLMNFLSNEWIRMKLQKIEGDLVMLFKTLPKHFSEERKTANKAWKIMDEVKKMKVEKKSWVSFSMAKNEESKIMVESVEKIEFRARLHTTYDGTLKEAEDWKIKPEVED